MTNLTVIGLPDPFKVLMALAEHLLGPAFWKMSGLRRTTTPYRAVKQLILNIIIRGGSGFEAL
ncbi:hypothetical protein BGX23_004331 [Mortierella sp. AD031]|nr:hypothetical protein BGX23_004331 [Mortierella sp. AD031]